jgi:hypothetical protein
MDRTGRAWMAGLAVLVGILGSQQLAATEVGDPIDIQVGVIDRVGIPSAELLSAQQEVARIYQELNISLIWIGSEFATGERRFVVHIVPTPPTAHPKSNEGVLGLAPGTKAVRGRRVWAFYNRIHDLAVERGARRSLVLGLVIAHEIGHLLLPHNSHTPTGLMSAGWDAKALASAQAGLLTFSAHQVALIRSRLQNVSGTAARR